MKAFANIEAFREYFAVKALPNPHILDLMQQLGFGFDCSSIPELLLSRSNGASADDIMFSSNNTTLEEFEAAASSGGCILNLDDINLVSQVPQMPELISFRYNPGTQRTGNQIIGDPLEAKYGVSDDQVVKAYQLAMQRGARRLGTYGAYHHIDVVGSLCENSDKFAIQRYLPEIEMGDILCIHDTGAHGHAMGLNYNGRLRPKELLLRSDGSVKLIRREERNAD